MFFTTNLPVILVVATVVIALLFKLHKIDDLEGKTAFIISDAIGLVSFQLQVLLLPFKMNLTS